MSGTTFGLEMKRTYKQHRNNQGTYYVGIGLNHSVSSLRVGMRGTSDAGEGEWMYEQ